MLNRVACYISNRLVVHNVINRENEDVYIYGLELLISSIFSTLLVIIIGAIIGKIVSTVLFLVVYILLRSYSGGYHANTYWACTVFTICTYLSVILLAMLIDPRIVAYISLLIVGVILLFMLAPVKNENKEISPEDFRKYRAISIIIFIGFTVLGFILSLVKPEFGSTVFFALCADLINLVVPKTIKNRRKEEV